MKQKVGILSAGAWGTAIGKVLSDKGYSVQMWDFMESVVEDINTRHKNSQYLPAVDLSENLTATSDLNEAADGKDYLIVASPSLYILNTVKQLTTIPSIAEGKTKIAVLTKGFLPSTTGPKLILPSMEDFLPGFYRDNLVYISGPSHAEEVARGKLTGLISASKNGKNSILFRELLNGTNLMVFSSLDTLGVQTCGAVKNVIALGFGMLDAMMELSTKFGDNTESLLLAAGLNEIQSIGMALGSPYPETFTSIAGVGDLDVTCRSKHGRNRRFGREIITDRLLDKYSGIEEVIDDMAKRGYLAEGCVAAKYAHEIGKGHKLKLPICDTVYAILNDELNPFDAIESLMRSLTGSNV
ncbi:MAG: NAD(P)-dependent glycerol-3-phosphate dehydrogenase [Spirochaetales bacterium]|nr:NAD(P)-dependent glycerol-3-phosphate dehydrogenase [Spirochaetales bacterium]